MGPWRIRFEPGSALRSIFLDPRGTTLEKSLPRMHHFGLIRPNFACLPVVRLESFRYFKLFGGIRAKLEYFSTYKIESPNPWESFHMGTRKQIELNAD